MGCCYSTETIDFDTIQPLVLRTQGGSANYSGTTERGHFQTFGDAELALTEDCFYSQVIDLGFCSDQGLLRIPVLTIKDIRQQSYFNKRYRTDYPHMVITYLLTDENGKVEHQAGWQMSNLTYTQWKKAIEQLRDSHPRVDQA